ncbi:alpha/beta-hydrolase [Massarina eburnea CBS 473.64]|uniref:Alpha/beta-hydrolase n=1 Tax=Massarina eburnea CBS 473.64 TaxID=1395130 RepID=A0A6A6RTZ3_9PLEO|nr:alpha/beta-hydrolase [Massarina eburnea CBS 473.64]
MDDFGFNISEHIIPCTHIRGYRHATKDATAVLRLAVKEYTPKTRGDVEQGAVTVIAAHANGIPKEAYEPVWEELRLRMGGKLRAIWFADSSHQGASGVLNEALQGDDPNYFDHSRDLLGMVNYFREKMKPPIVGVAHSMGCTQLTHLSFTHPRLFTGLLFIEPVMVAVHPPGPNASRMTSVRPDLWSSREAARADFQKNPFYRSWDPRTLDKYITYGLRQTPTLVYPDAKPGSVTLTTTKHQEAWLFLRSNFRPAPVDGKLDEGERLTTADFNEDQASFVFHRAEPGLAVSLLPHIQPHVLWVYGGKSYVNKKGEREKNVALTGIQNRANGGVEAGAVKMHIVEKGSHMFPLQMVTETADVIAPFLKEMSEKGQREEKFWQSYDSQKSERDGLVLSEMWKQEASKKKYENRPAGKDAKL